LLTIQNTTTSQVRNLFSFIAVFISFALGALLLLLLLRQLRIFLLLLRAPPPHLAPLFGGGKYQKKNRL
jgi:uncharacterized membrane protein YdcZ (DUF606 family)